MGIDGGTVALVACAGLVMLLLARGIRARGTGGRRLQPEASVHVGWDELRLWVRYPDGKELSVPWSGLRGVSIRTTDEGPWRPDVFWILEGSDGQLAICPQGATGEEGLPAVLRARLPGLDDAQLIRAMGSTGNALFKLWERDDAALPA